MAQKLTFYSSKRFHSKWKITLKVSVLRQKVQPNLTILSIVINYACYGKRRKGIAATAAAYLHGRSKHIVTTTAISVATFHSRGQKIKLMAAVGAYFIALLARSAHLHVQIISQVAPNPIRRHACYRHQHSQPSQIRVIL